MHATLLGAPALSDEAPTPGRPRPAQSGCSRSDIRLPSAVEPVPCPATPAARAAVRPRPGADAAVLPVAALALPLPDHVLVARVMGRNAAGEDALATLYDRYASAVFRLGRRLLRDDGAAEDVLQETFWRLWSQAGRYEPDRGRFSSWLLRIATNLATDAHRLAARRPSPGGGTASWSEGPDGDVPTAPEPADLAPSIPDQVWGAELRRVLTTGLAGLPPVQRQAVALAYFGGLTHVQIAAAQGAPCSTVKTRLALGLRKLAVHLGAHGVTRADGTS